MTNPAQDELDMSAEVDLKIEVSNGWWGMYSLTAENAEKVMQYASDLTGEDKSHE